MDKYGKNIDIKANMLYNANNSSAIKRKETTDCSEIAEEEFSEILKDNVEIPLIKERFEIVKEISRIVKEK